MSTSKLIRHLLPRSEAWKSAISRNMTKLLDGFGDALDDVREYYDQIFYDQFPETTRFVREMEGELGIPPGSNDATSRLNIAAELQATGGQGPDYLQEIIHAAGFTTVFLHEPWATTNPYSARDPRVYTEIQYFGEEQFAIEGADQSFFMTAVDQQTFGAMPQDLFGGISLQSNYLDNDTLQDRVLPTVPDDPQYWPFFLYVAGETFPNPAVIDPDRRHELIRLIMKLRPLNMWVVFLLTYEEPGDNYFLFEEGNGFDESYWF